MMNNKIYTKQIGFWDTLNVILSTVDIQCLRGVR